MRVAVPALRLAAPLSSRVRRGVTGRHASLASLQDWAATHRDRGRPLLWLHAPSVGEALMAQAILSGVRERQPGIQSVFTFFSPSAERVAERVGADCHGYLPWDRTHDIGAVLDALRPSCVAFVRTEIWPVLVREARARGAAVVMVNGVLSPESSRAGRGGRLLLGTAYRRLHAVGVVSAEDAGCFRILGIPKERIQVTGDARFDQVWQRVQNLDRDQPLLRELRAIPGPRLVAGSTWAADEELIVSALSHARARVQGWRCIIAPHEPTPTHIDALENRLDAAQLTHARLGSEGAAAAEVIVVDRTGVLADLYATADAAYVGGGFGSAGLHSVVEPAALGVPVLYGPRHGNAREALRLSRVGGGFVVADGAELRTLLTRLGGSAAERQRAGTAARRFVAAHTGGASASAQLIIDAMRRTGG